AAPANTKTPTLPATPPPRLRPLSSPPAAPAACLAAAGTGSRGRFTASRAALCYQSGGKRRRRRERADSMAEQAGYSGTPLARKLGIGEGDEVVVIGAPNGFADRLAFQVGDEAGVHTDLADAALFDVIVAFVTRPAQLESELDRLRARMA